MLPPLNFEQHWRCLSETEFHVLQIQLYSVIDIALIYSTRKLHVFTVYWSDAYGLWGPSKLFRFSPLIITSTCSNSSRVAQLRCPKIQLIYLSDSAPASSFPSSRGDPIKPPAIPAFIPEPPNLLGGLPVHPEDSLKMSQNRSVSSAEAVHIELPSGDFAMWSTRAVWARNSLIY